MVVAADLVSDPACRDMFGLPAVRAGPETARVCDTAIELALEFPDATVIATAGYSHAYKVALGNGPMRQYLRRHGIRHARICTPEAQAFDTNGEMEELAKHLHEGDVAHLVCRWWHLPRAWLLLRARLGKERRKEIKIRPVPVWTFHDPLGMAREPLAWIKNTKNLIGAL